LKFHPLKYEHGTNTLIWDKSTDPSGCYPPTKWQDSPRNLVKLG